MPEQVDQLTLLKAALANQYLIRTELGQGGMATVYLAEDLKHDRQVALKVLKPELAAVLGAKRFLREIQVTANLHHPHILPLFDSGEADGFLYYVMPYVDGESLRARLNRAGPLPLEDAVQIAHEVADALSYAHGHGVIHRDVKPENILIDSGHAVVADFGIALAVDQAGGERLTETGLALGTPHYMSPEQAMGDPAGPQSDVYSLGCVLYESLAGEPPFTGPTTGSVIAKHATAERPSVRVVRDTVSSALDAAIMKAMAKLPADRFSDARAFDRVISAAAAPAPSRRRAWRIPALVTAATVLAGSLAVVWTRHGPASGLDPSRIMVFPLVVSEGFPGPASAGEDVATLIGSALDGTGPLRWIDGWTQLDPELRRNIRELSEADARGLARAQRCGYYVSGRVLSLDDSTAQILLTLYDVQDGSEVKRSAATAPPSQPWKGARAVNTLLPELITGARPVPSSAWERRPPQAIASFLLGEAAVRRLRITEARERFRDAVAADSSFALAALRGAQAASWDHQATEAAAFLRVAGQHPLAPRDAAFVHGYQAYLEGRADSAVAGFNTALALDGDMAVAWMQLGETWRHLLPTAGSPNDSALTAFEQALWLDSAAVGPMFHILELLLVRGDTSHAAPLLRRFVAADPPARYVDQLRIMDWCVRRGVERVPWDSVAQASPFYLLLAGRGFLASEAHLGCAEVAFNVLLRTDTTAEPEAENRRFWEILGLVSVLLARGRDDEMLAKADSFVRRWNSGSTLFLLAAPYHSAAMDRARAVAQNDRAKYGPTYAGLRFSTRLWELGLLEATWGNIATAQAVASELAAGDRAGREGRGRALAASVEAHVALARGDSARALELFDGVVPAVAPGDVLPWDEALAGGADRLAYARLLAAHGEYRQAIEVADMLDSRAPFVYALYLEAGLRLRLDAATALGDTRLADQLRARLAALRS